jgi:hypothetical protein
LLCVAQGFLGFNARPSCLVDAVHNLKVYG